MKLPSPIGFLLVAVGLAACSGQSSEGEPAGAPGSLVDASPTVSAADASAPGASADAGAMGDMPGMNMHGTGGDGGADASALLPPTCDEDNILHGNQGGVDIALPPSIVQYQRQGAWGCMHREWHDVRRLDLMELESTTYASELAFVHRMGWKRASAQEGASGNGLEFLAMHRSMLTMLRTMFPQYAQYFVGWPAAPTVSTSTNPVPNTSAFNPYMEQALSELQTNIGMFPSDDAIGTYIQTQMSPTASNVAARSADRTAGIHAYYHVRFDDPKSPIRMQRFSRNVESVIFWKLHGWLDNQWTRYRQAKGAVDAKDTVYLDAMNAACAQMGAGPWLVDAGHCAM